MAVLKVNGREIELNEEGFMVDPRLWDDQVAQALAAAEENLDTLSSEHWAVIRFIRDYFQQNQSAPMVRLICKTTELPLKKIYELFPSGPAKGACKLAGLPKPDGCV